MEFTPFQKDILDYIAKHPESSAKEIIDGTKISRSTVNNELKFLTRIGELNCDSKRQPYFYSLNLDSASVEWRKAVREIRQALNNKDVDTDQFTNLARKFNPSSRSKIRQRLLQLTEALYEDELERTNVATLETPDEQKTA